MNRSEQIRAALPLLSELDRIALEDALHDELDERCSQVNLKPVAGCPGSFEADETSGVLFWLQSGLALTTDDHWQTKGTPAHAPFPKLGYLRHLFGAMLKLLAFPELKRSSLFICKSRDMMCSYSVMGYATWAAQWRPQTFFVLQTQKEQKVVELLRYCRTLYHSQPIWLQERHPLEADNVLEMRWKNGSRVLGVPGGEAQIRIHHPFAYVVDEAAFLPDFEECLNAVLPVAPQIIALSTAAPSRFMDLCGLDTEDSNWQSATKAMRKDDSTAFTGPETVQHAARDPEPSSGSAALGQGGVRHMLDNGMPEIRRP
jgi:hypothetical protein